MLSKGRDSMGYDGSLKFDTKIDESGFNSGVKRLGSIAKGGLAVLGSAVAGVTAAMGAGIAAGIKYNASIEQYQTSFEVMTGSADKAAEVIERLRKVGAETPFELNNLADTTQLLMNYGFTADDAMDRMMMLGDIAQGSADKMSRIAMAYGQMSSAGKVSLEDIKQMIEAGFNPLQEISDSTGESMKSLYDRISKGTISVDEITASMQRATSEGGKYFQSMEKQSQTIDGLISTLKDNAQQLLGEVVQPIAESFKTELLPTAIDAVEQLSNAFSENGTEGLVEAGGQIVVNLLTGITESLPGIVGIAVQIINSIIVALGENLPQILSAGGQIVSSLIEGILLILHTLDTTGSILVQQLISSIGANLPTVVATGFQTAGEFINGILQKLPEVISSAGIILNGFLEYVIINLPSILDAGVELILSLVNGIIQSFPEIVSSAVSVVGKLLRTILDNAPQLIEGGLTLIGKLAAGIINAVPDLIAKIPGIISDIKEEFTSIDWGQVGKDILSGIANGVVNGVGSLVTAARNAAESALDAIKRKLGIHSPSTVFRDQVGKNMALGMGLGFEKNVPISEISKSLDNAVDDIQSKTLRVRLNSITRSLNESATNGIRAGKTVDDDRSRERQNEDKDPIDYKRLGREMGKRPIYVSAKLNDREVVKMTAKPMKEQMDNDEKIRKMLKGEPVWA